VLDAIADWHLSRATVTFTSLPLQFALRWRTETEVLSGAGEETCGNTRCTFHEPSRSIKVPPLKTVELPFAYEEKGTMKSALVKVVLCDKCLKKLMWKRHKERAERGDGSEERVVEDGKDTEHYDETSSSGRKDRRERDSKTKEHRRDDNSRSRSPRRRERRKDHNNIGGDDKI